MSRDHVKDLSPVMESALRLAEHVHRLRASLPMNHVIRERLTPICDELHTLIASAQAEEVQ